MKTLIIKSLLTSLCQREVRYPSLEKRGKGRFFNNDALLMNSLVRPKILCFTLFALCVYGSEIHIGNTIFSQGYIEKTQA
jgi:hypothetical protein